MDRHLPAPSRLLRAVTASTLAGRLPNYSGGPAPDFHRLPFSPRFIRAPRPILFPLKRIGDTWSEVNELGKSSTFHSQSLRTEWTFSPSQRARPARGKQLVPCEVQECPTGDGAQDPQEKRTRERRTKAPEPAYEENWKARYTISSYFPK